MLPSGIFYSVDETYAGGQTYSWFGHCDDLDTQGFSEGVDAALVNMVTSKWSGGGLGVITDEDGIYLVRSYFTFPVLSH